MPFGCRANGRIVGQAGSSRSTCAKALREEDHDLKGKLRLQFAVLTPDLHDKQTRYATVYTCKDLRPVPAESFFDLEGFDGACAYFDLMKLPPG